MPIPSMKKLRGVDNKILKHITSQHLSSQFSLTVFQLEQAIIAAASPGYPAFLAWCCCIICIISVICWCDCCAFFTCSSIFSFLNSNSLPFPSQHCISLTYIPKKRNSVIATSPTLIASFLSILIQLPNGYAHPLHDPLPSRFNFCLSFSH